MSDEYQSMLGLTIDIMAMSKPASDEPWDEVEAIVLLDEIGAHLHPRWKMQVVAGLRRAFKRMQFVSTTHDPLCLRGMRKDEVAVFRRPIGGSPYILEGLPSIEGLRVDQLLTSEYFGLSSTLDPDIEAEFNEYYALLSRTRPTAAETMRREELRTKLISIEFAGTTRRERMMLDEVDRFLSAERRARSNDEANQLLVDTRKRIARQLDAQTKPEQ